jgi:hypothetical protein
VIQRQEFVISRQEVPQTACVQQLPNGKPYQIASGGRPPGATLRVIGAFPGVAFHIARTNYRDKSDVCEKL